MRTGTKQFDWVKALPDVLANYNTKWHTSIKALPLELIQGKKDNPIERKVVESTLKKGDRERIKHKKSLFDKGDVSTFSKEKRKEEEQEEREA